MKKAVQIEQFLKQNANVIQKRATQLHKKFLGGKHFRTEIINKYQVNHIKIVEQLANSLKEKDIKKGLSIFKKLGDILATDSINDGLTIEEAVDGIIFLKQALIEQAEKAGIVKKLSVEEFYSVSYKVGVYIDVVTSEIAFTYHNNFKLQTEKGKKSKKDIEANLAYLAEVSKILSSSLDYKATLTNIARLAVPQIADWCSIELKTETGIEHVAIAHVDPKKVKWAKALRKSQPTDLNSSTGLARVFRTGKSELYSDINDEILVASAKNKEELELMRKLNMTSTMLVPLTTGNDVIGVILVISAESKRHYTKAELTIAEEVASRAALAIENARLYNEAKRAITLRDEFISVASHELKTPVTSLKMYTQVLQKQLERRGDVSAKRPLAQMEAQLNRLNVLISDLLNVSKLQHGKLEFTIESIDVNEVVKDTVEAVQATERKHDIITIGRITKKVQADRYRIYQVLTNLLTNAIKYSPLADKIIVTLTAEKDVAVISVQDFGIGINDFDQKKIFEQFYRVTSPEEKTYPGLGMGLFIANEIVKRHGGSMTISSKKGKGSLFTFTLPYLQSNGKSS